jgi:hypothetical protein
MAENIWFDARPITPSQPVTVPSEPTPDCLATCYAAAQRAPWKQGLKGQ